MDKEGLIVYKFESTFELTLNKEYKVYSEGNSCYYIINDKNEKMSYPKHWFKQFQ